jgi:hypothetical protein
MKGNGEIIQEDNAEGIKISTSIMDKWEKGPV